MKFSTKLVLIGFAVFLLMQVYQPARNTDSGQVLPTHFAKVDDVPSNVVSILKNSCYDCHSNNTAYPWYANVQPARFLMESHIKEGKENLNFSEWGDYSPRMQRNKLDRMLKQIEKNEMPLASYTLIHRNAVLSESQKKEIIDWLNSKITNE